MKTDEEAVFCLSVVCPPSSVLRLVDHAHDVGLLHDQKLVAFELDLGARPLAEQHAVAGLDAHRGELAAFVAATGADGDDFALLRLFLHGVGNDDAALGLRLGVDTLDNHPVMEWPELELRHCSPLSPPLKRPCHWTESRYVAAH